MKNCIIILFLVACSISIYSQENLTYQKPSKEILDLVDIELAPSVMMDDNKTVMIYSYRSAYKTITELSEKEMRLGGLRINPKTNIGSRTNYVSNLKIRIMTGKDDSVKDIKNLPSNPRISNLRWSPDQKKIAFTQTTTQGVELWYVDIHNAIAHRLTDSKINANMGDVINWFEDSNSILVKFISKDKKSLIDVQSSVPVGPTISVADGKKAQNRTYQDLLKSPNDEHNFEQLALSELYRINLDGSSSLWKATDMYGNLSFSPDGQYIMITTIKKPFSYLVPYRRFPSKTDTYTQDGSFVATVSEVPLIEDLPKGFMATREGRRSLSWRSDKPATIVFAKALDGGDPENKVEFRDELFLLNAPFTGEGSSLIKTINRFSGITWGNDRVAIASDYWWNDRNTKSYLFNPSNANDEVSIIEDRNYQDVYSNPGRFVMKRNSYGSYVLEMEGETVFLIGDGHTDQGQFPFLDKMNLRSGHKERIYRSEYTDKLEGLNEYDPSKNQLMVRIESPTEYPNYYYRNLDDGTVDQITDFANPFKSIQDVHKEVISYTREDGLELSGTLYLPVGYDTIQKEKMPMILWAYPREYKDKSSASQNTQNPNEFTYPFWGSALYWVSKGYVVLDDAAFPIVGEKENEPNDSFRTQLVANAKAAIDAVDQRGFIDPDRVAVGGHSYGAFMVANLLSHSNLFAAGIARSGAYNRTLTPFGFQSEERSYWDAPEVYYTMSPFMHADKMKTPLLLVHGEADNNSGTYPLQSERYFNALKGLGATVRLVMLPKESHGYRAKESILHLLWEQDQWLDRYVKNKNVQIDKP